MSFANWDEIIETCRHHMADTDHHSLAVLQEAQSLDKDEDRTDHVFDTMLAQQYGI